MGMKGDLSDFECGIVVGGLSFSGNADQLGFSCTTKGWSRKYPVRGSSVSESTDARGQRRMARLVRVDKKAMATTNSNNHLLQLRHAQEHF